MNPNAPISDRNDPLPELVEIVRDAIEYGLIASETVYNFNYTISQLTGPELEDYVQKLWDEL